MGGVGSGLGGGGGGVRTDRGGSGWREGWERGHRFGYNGIRCSVKGVGWRRGGGVGGRWGGLGGGWGSDIRACTDFFFNHKFAF